MPDAILMDIIEKHLPYEIDMLRRTHTQLSKIDEADEQRAIRNALIESFCIHARSLLHFFANNKMRITDAIAKEFTT